MLHWGSPSNCATYVDEPAPVLHVPMVVLCHAALCASGCLSLPTCLPPGGCLSSARSSGQSQPRCWRRSSASSALDREVTAGATSCREAAARLQPMLSSIVAGLHHRLLPPQCLTGR